MDNFMDISYIIETNLTKLPDSRTKVHEAEDLSTTFLIVQNKISSVVLELEMDMNEARSVGKFLYHNTLSQSDAKNATEKKAEAEADEEYRKVEKLERDLKSKVAYLKVQQSIFNDAHLVCRNIMREK